MFGYGDDVDERNPGCTACSFVADHFDGVAPHLNGHDVTLAAESIAPLEELRRYKQRMGWRFPWVSSLGGEFKYDFGAAFTDEQQRSGAEYNFRPIHDPGEQAPGMSAFALDDGIVYHTYSTYARGVEQLMGTYRYLDLAPLGRNETGYWWRRHDAYDTPARYNAKIIAEFRANRGHVGGMWEETPLLLLHHTGAKSGQSRVNPVAYLPIAERYLIWAANGGAPVWWRSSSGVCSHMPPTCPWLARNSAMILALYSTGVSSSPIVAAPPVPGLVAAERREVEEPVGPHQLLDPPGVGGVGVVDDPVVERRRAHPVPSPRDRGWAKLMLGAARRRGRLELAAAAWCIAVPTKLPAGRRPVKVLAEPTNGGRAMTASTSSPMA